jgi:hypothetical protein
VNQRFQLRAVEEKGHRVAVIFDAKANRTFRVYKHGRRYFHWTTATQPVTVDGLRECAREALA